MDMWMMDGEKEIWLLFPQQQDVQERRKLLFNVQRALIHNHWDTRLSPSATKGPSTENAANPDINTLLLSIFT